MHRKKFRDSFSKRQLSFPTGKYFFHSYLTKGYKLFKIEKRNDSKNERGERETNEKILE